jgi:uncharacterized membrane protein YesL
MFANIVYSLFGACIVAGFAVIGFSWERMRQQVNQVLAPEEQIPWHPQIPQTFSSLFWKTNEIGYFLSVLDLYRKIYPSNPLPKNVALGIVVWILCFMALLASAVGR